MPAREQLLHAVYTLSPGASVEEAAIIEHSRSCFHCRLEIHLYEAFLRGKPVPGSKQAVARILARLKLPPKK